MRPNLSVDSACAFPLNDGRNPTDALDALAYHSVRSPIDLLCKRRSPLVHK
jgi:hypothetical protein